jgi:hypothetical protein
VKRPRDRPAKAISVNDAFQLLLAALKKPHVAAERLHKAWRENACRLWCNGNLLDPNYIRVALAVRVVSRHRIKIVSATREAWERKRYRWQVDAAEIAELLPPPSSGPGADNKPRRTGSRMQRLIRQIADGTWPGGWEDIETRHIIKIVGQELKNRGEHVPERSTFERALGRRRPR